MAKVGCNKHAFVLLVATGGLFLASFFEPRAESSLTRSAYEADEFDLEDSTMLQMAVGYPSTFSERSAAGPRDSSGVTVASPDPEENRTTYENPIAPNMAKIMGTDLLGDPLNPTEHGTGTKSHSEEGNALPHRAHRHGYLAIIFLFGGLTLGSLILMFNERFTNAVPYTCLLFVAGFLISAVHHLKDQTSWLTWPSWYSAVDMWEEMDPHLLFYVFLPALVFSEAMKMNVHQVKSCFGQILIMAGPGVVLTTLLLGAFAHYILPYQWDWPICLVLGSILSATDPVAVVALFNTLGVSPRLTMIISGESLFNDGTAVVCFTLMLKVLLGASLTPFHVVLFFANMTVLSSLLGFIVASVALWGISCCALERGQSDAMVQVVITICCGYTCFFMAESELSTSGILSLVSAGLVLAGSIWPRFVSKEVVHIVWEAIEFIGNTVVFLLAGLLFANSCFSRAEHIYYEDFLYLFIMYAAVVLVRVLVVMFLWMPLQYAGHPLNWKEGLVMVWAGLRGAVSLALAIIVDIEPMVSKQMGTRVMFHVGGIAGLTLLINSTTTAKLLQKLGLTSEPEGREQMLLHLRRHMNEVAQEAMQTDFRKGQDVRFKDVDPELVYAMAPRLRQDEAILTKSLSNLSTKSLAAESMRRLAANEKNYREVFLEVVNCHYWRAIEDGIIPRNDKVARVLLGSKDEAMNETHKQLSDWEPIFNAVDVLPASNSVGELLSRLSQSSAFSWIPGMSQMFPSMEVVNAWKVYAALSFLEAHRLAREEVPRYFDASDSLLQQVKEKVAKESLDECSKAQQLLSQIPVQAVSSGKSRMLAQKLLRIQLHQVEKLRSHGVLTNSEAHNFEDELRHVLNTVRIEPHAKKTPS